MTALPSASDFTGSGVTEAQFKTSLSTLIAYLSGLLDAPGTPESALSKLGALGANTATKAGAYTVNAADRGTVFLCSGTFTLSLTAAATLGNGFSFAVINTGIGTITIDPSVSEQIDAATTLILGPGQSCVVHCTGTTFFTVGKARGGADYQVFTSSGVWSKPSGGTVALIRCWGAGGSGARWNGSYAGGGGGGGYSEKWVLMSALGATETVTIGTGGAAVSGSNVVGNDGGNTIFGAHLTAYGGKGGGLPSTTAGKGGNGGGPLSTSPMGEGEATNYTIGSLAMLNGVALKDIATNQSIGYAAGVSTGKSGTLWGGGGGSCLSGAVSGAGGSSIYGGGGGAGQNTSGVGVGGSSIYGGAGGSCSSGLSGSGTAPGGGGAGSGGAQNSGAGGAGRVEVIVF